MVITDKEAKRQDSKIINKVPILLLILLKYYGIRLNFNLIPYTNWLLALINITLQKLAIIHLCKS